MKKQIMKKQAVALMGVGVLATLTACQTSADAPSTKSATPMLSTTMDSALASQLLQVYDWQLLSVTDKAGKPAAQELFASGIKPLLVSFDKSNVRLKNTCNNMWGGYKVADGRLAVGDMASTMMLCEPALMAVDRLAPSLITGAYTVDKPQAKLPILTITSDGYVSQFQAVQK